MRGYFDLLKSLARSCSVPARVERQDVDARRHQLARHAVAEIDDRLSHFPFARLEDALFLADVDVRLHLFVGDLLRLGLELFLLLQAREHSPQW